MKHLLAATLLLGGALARPALADDAHHKGLAQVAQAGGQLTEGEVRRVDKDAKKITIKHGPISNLDMPPMTMVFQVKDPAVLERVKPGDNVKFSADRVNGAYTITGIEIAR